MNFYTVGLGNYVYFFENKKSSNLKFDFKILKIAFTTLTLTIFKTVASDMVYDYVES